MRPASALYAARIAYDGSSYHGFQRQIGSQPTIQSELEQALGAVTGETITIRGAGRTDSGVHALGQVVSFTANWNHEPEALRRALNANLPQAIAILQLVEINPPFHPRFDALQRAYRYQILNSLVRIPTARLTHWHVKRPLDLSRMNRAAALLIGEHDFATFGQPPQGENTVREVTTAAWSRSDEVLTFDISANAFLYRMVRSIVGSLVKVGDGSWNVDQFQAALRAADRSRSGPVAPPQGVFLLSVMYAQDIFSRAPQPAG